MTAMTHELAAVPDPNPFSTIEEAIDDIRHGKFVVVVDAPDRENEGDLTWFDAPPEIARYCVDKGSIAVDGTSLTVAAVDDAGFAVALIPHTLGATTLGSLALGDPVNLEVVVLAKYVERLRA